LKGVLFLAYTRYTNKSILIRLLSIWKKLTNVDKNFICCSWLNANFRRTFWQICRL